MKAKIRIIAAAAVYALVMAAATVWDLPVSANVADTTAEWALFLEAFAEIPTLIVCALLLLYLYHYYSAELKTRKALACALCVIGASGAAVYSVRAFLLLFNIRQSDEPLEYWLIIATSLIPLLLFIGFIAFKLRGWLTNRLEKHEYHIYSAKRADSAEKYGANVPVKRGKTPETRVTERKIAHAALSCVIAALVTLALVNLLKITWGRVRFRDMLAAIDREYTPSAAFDAFTPWYVPNGINGNRSFPSGHAANCILLTFMTYFNRLLPPRSALRYLNYLVPAAVTLAVAVSRVILGAHYVSDVATGMALTALIVYVTGRTRGEYD